LKLVVQLTGEMVQPAFEIGGAIGGDLEVL